MDISTQLQAIGATLRSLRVARGISQEAFADSIEMHRAYYSSIERGARNVTISTLIKICDGLRTSPSEILRKSDL
jgi:transcriptional regulator with XRE-family HTH domain